MRSLLALTALIVAFSGPVLARDPCGREGPACETPLGAYRVALPAEAGPHPLVVFLHGAGGSGASVLGMRGTIAALTDRGYAVLAPDGLPWREGGGGGWSFLPASIRSPRRDEGAFLAGIVADAAERFGLDPERAILAGFSAGAFMTVYLACDTPDAFAAYAPVSGGFWRPQPEQCAGPVRLFQTHGFTDGTVPLEGRVLGGGRFRQGDIYEGMTLWRETNGCEQPNPTGYSVTGAFQRRYWDCAPGSALEFALFPEGHRVPDGWAGMMLGWFEALPPR